ncbi:hypothetical protein VSS92_27720, partial [Pseudomonas syringae pv. tagetis]
CWGWGCVLGLGVVWGWGCVVWGFGGWCCVCGGLCLGVCCWWSGLGWGGGQWVLLGCAWLWLFFCGGGVCVVCVVWVFWGCCWCWFWWLVLCWVGGGLLGLVCCCWVGFLGFVFFFFCPLRQPLLIMVSGVSVFFGGFGCVGCGWLCRCVGLGCWRGWGGWGGRS